MTEENKAQKKETPIDQSKLNALLFAFAGEMEKNANVVLEHAKENARTGPETSQQLTIIGGVIGIISDSIRGALEKSK